MEFKDKYVLVTGGTSGIGQKIVEQLLLNGAYVYINYGNSSSF